MSMHKNVITLCCAAAFALGLAACSSSDDPPPPPPPMPTDPEPTAYEAGKAAIMAATTAADAQAAYDAIDQSMVSGDEAASLMMALNDRVAAIMAATAYARGKAAIMAATTVQGAQDAYDAIDQTAITGEQASTLQMALSTRQDEIRADAREAAQRMALMNAANAIDTTDLSTAQAIADAKADIAALQAALDAAADVDPADTAMYQTQLDDANEAVRMAETGLAKEGRMAAQRMALSNAVTMARTMVAGVDDDSTDSEVAAADSAIAALKMAIADAVDLPTGDTDVAMAQGTLATLEPDLAARKTSRMAAMEDADDEDREAMAEVGEAMHAALGAPDTPVGNSGPLANIAQPVLVTTGPAPLTINAADGAGSTEGDLDTATGLTQV